MPKITFMGAGSTIFAKNVLGDCLLTESLQDSVIALYDIDRNRLNESRLMLENLNKNINNSRARIETYLGVPNRKKALQGADYVVNAIQVGGYEPSTVIDFEIPKKFGLRQTIADTLGIGGIFRSLRTIPVVRSFAEDMKEVCPDAWFLNYVNPMATITSALLREGIKSVGLCHSVQGCASYLLHMLGFNNLQKVQWKIAGINHMAWLLEITDNGRDLYPEIKKRAFKEVERIRKIGAKKLVEQAMASGREDWRKDPEVRVARDMVRLLIMRHFGHYVTESSEHNAEYMPYWIKSAYPELIDELNIPLDEYPRRCINQINGWRKRKEELINNAQLSHKRTHEYGSYIMDAMETDVPFRIGGNIANTGLITNLPAKACVEVPCLVDRNGVQGCYVGDLPEQLAALNRTNINVQILTVEAAFTLKKDLIYQAAMLDPHTSAELSIDRIVALCDALIQAHGRIMPKFK